MKYNIYHGKNENGQIKLEIAPPLHELAIAGIASQLVQREDPSDWGGKPLGSLDVTRQDIAGTAFAADQAPYSGRKYTHAQIAEKIADLMDPFRMHEITFVPPID